MANLKLQNIVKEYSRNGNKVIDGLSLDIEDEEFIVLVGPSGCGKSTLLKIIAGLEDITEGELYIDGEYANNIESRDRDISMMFQNYALYPHMTVYENIAFPLKLKNISKDIIDSEVRDIANRLKIKECLYSKPREISGGQKQRVALGRAIIRKPRVFLMDEPLSNLDAKLRVETRTEIRKLHEDLKTTFIYVTHDQIEAMTMGDRIIVMDKGVIQQIDTPHNIYNRPANKFVAGFIGSPQMNFIEGIVEDDKGKLVFKSRKFNRKLERRNVDILEKNSFINKRVILGIRPEHIDIDYKENNPLGISAEIELIEYIGSEAYVHIAHDEKNIIAKIDVIDNKFKKGNVRILFEEEKLFFFDAETEEALY